MLLLTNADVYAPAPRGVHSLIGGGTVLWMGADPPTLPPARRGARARRR